MVNSYPNSELKLRTDLQTRRHGCFSRCGNLVRACLIEFSRWYPLNVGEVGSRLQEPKDDQTTKSICAKLVESGILCAVGLFRDIDKRLNGKWLLPSVIRYADVCRRLGLRPCVLLRPSSNAVNT